ncbi:MAG: DUF2341 domain-containing protein [Chitinivibrionales bacterium]|nr:DUF2341 domain-containing protein [Chitinivibrionales bacterium]
MIRNKFHSLICCAQAAGTLLFLLGCVLPGGCTSPVAKDGSGEGSATEVVACRGTVRYESGDPVVNATVFLRKKKWVPGNPLSDPLHSRRISANTSTNENGFFTIDSLDTGVFFIEISDTVSHAALVDFVVEESDSQVLDLGTSTAKPFATIVGKVDSSAGIGYVRIFGMERLIPVSDSGIFKVGNLPEGTFRFRIDPSSPGAEPITIDSVGVRSGEYTLISTAGAWTRRARVDIDAQTGGMLFSENVQHFPLLVRLNRSNFNFEMAQSNGEDIRFVKADGTHFPFEIEQWDSTAGTAAVWVLVDTIYVDAVTQMQLFWGNPAASAASSGHSVFSPQFGVVGAWHLTASGQANRPNSAQDAFHARPGLYDGDEQVVGLIGMCDSLDLDDHDTLGNINPAFLTISAWIAPSQKNNWARIVHKPADGVYHSWGFIYNQPATAGEHMVQGVMKLDTAGQTLTSQNPVALEQWTHICLTFDGLESALFINGIEELRYRKPGTLAAADYNTYIAWEEKDLSATQKFIGKIDEVRIESVARSAEWIRLSYENQKPGSSLVEIK